MTTENNTIFIVDDNPAMCEALRWLLEAAHFKVEAYNSAQTFLQQYSPTRQGCILLDVRMPDTNGLELQEKLVSQYNPIPIIMITAYGDIPMAVRAIKAGAFDFITKPFEPQELLKKIQTVTEQNNNQREIQRRFAQRLALLTSREREIMERVIAGKLNKQIAYEFGISIKTVELHRAHVMQKMQVKSLAELVKISLLIGVNSISH
jgi:two-component system response regulator FixJ